MRFDPRAEDIVQTITDRYYFNAGDSTIKMVVTAVLEELDERQDMADRLQKALAASSDGA